jgi:NADH-quinone oxidoreductase subunit G
VVRSLADVPLDKAQKGVLICGARAGKSEIQLPEKGVKLVLLQPGPNGFGAALLSEEYGGTSLEAALASNKVRGIFALEADIPKELLKGVVFVAAADWRSTESSQQASVFLPTTPWTEGEGTWINYEGRAQGYRRALRTGLPLRGLPERYYGTLQTPPPAHPPRVHRAVPPGGEALDSWRLVARLIEKISKEPAGDPWAGKWGVLKEIDPEGAGLMIVPALQAGKAS